MIKSFGDTDTYDLFRGSGSNRWINIRCVAMRKLVMLDSATRLDELRIPPSNRLKPLKGDRSGFHSIRVNDQYRIVFVWKDGAPHGVTIVDYH
ncbi:proteic killer suppression protein [Luteibacter sp. 621]|uniref:type II toxin-antitoxin system RelE/ParE family toxin n=1 Tax=Luteibacter sp. 621 TaxID=3373916 RepID=UPI003D2353D2